MALGIDLRGIDQVIESFNLNGTPFFAIYQGKDLKFQHLENDIDSASELLQNNLRVLEQGGSTAPLKIVYYYDVNAAGKLTNENIKGSNTFRVCNPGAYNSAGYGSNEIIVPYRERKNDAYEQRIAALELQLSEEAEEEEAPQAVGGFNGVLMGLLNNPQVQEVIIGRLLTVLDKILPPPQNSNAPAMVSGASDQDEQIKYCLQTLFSKGMTVADLQKLKNIAETQTLYFNSLLSMLRG